MKYPELKIKIKALAEEARIIRKEEKNKSLSNLQREKLYLHRVGIVRRESRATHLAYAYLRNKLYRDCERTCHTPPNLTAIERMVKKYGNLPSAISITDWFTSNSERIELE